MRMRMRLGTAPSVGLPRGAFVVLAIVMPFLIWMTFNSWDEPLEPDARAVIEAPPQAVPPEQNLFLALLAFPIAGDEPAHELGLAAIGAHARGGFKAPTYAEALDRAAARFDSQNLAPCHAGNREGAYECMARSRALRPQVEELFVPMQPLFERYHALPAYPQYADLRPPTLDMPMTDASALRVGLLWLSALTFALDQGKTDAVIASLHGAVQAWRRVLAAGPVTLVDKMMASSALTAHTLFISEMLRGPQPLSTAQLDALTALLRPLSETERSLAGPLAQEFRMQARVWSEIARPDSAIVQRDFPNIPDWLYRLLVKQNDTINRGYHDLENAMAIERGGCKEIAARVSREPEDRGLSWYEYFYNPLGRVLQNLGSSSANYVEYFGRQCNLLALHQAVNVQLELRRLDSHPDTRPEQVKALAALGGSAIAYDAAHDTLVFKVLGDDQRGLSPLPLGGK